jgi:DNA-binding protein H-NS
VDSFGHDIPAQHEESAPSLLKAQGKAHPTAGQAVTQLVADLHELNDEDLSTLSKDLDKLHEALPTEFARRREHYLAQAAKFGVPAAVPVKKDKGAKTTAGGTARKSTAGGVLPVKYRNPDGPEGWSGRGMTPRWMNVAINASGGRLRKDDFLAGGAAFAHKTGGHASGHTDKTEAEAEAA